MPHMISDHKQASELVTLKPEPQGVQSQQVWDCGGFLRLTRPTCQNTGHFAGPSELYPKVTATVSVEKWQQFLPDSPSSFPRVYPFALFIWGVSLLKPDIRKKGGTFKGLLGNLALRRHYPPPSKIKHPSRTGRVLFFFFLFV